MSRARFLATKVGAVLAKATAMRERKRAMTFMII
jgi:hypothetical protein